MAEIVVDFVEQILGQAIGDVIAVVFIKILDTVWVVLKFFFSIFDFALKGGTHQQTQYNHHRHTDAVTVTTTSQATRLPEETQTEEHSFVGGNYSHPNPDTDDPNLFSWRFFAVVLVVCLVFWCLKTRYRLL